MKIKAMLGGVLPLLAALLLVTALSLTVKYTLSSRTAESMAVAVCDMDGSALSRALIRSLEGGGAIMPISTDAGGARRLILRGRAEGVLTIPVGYADAVATGGEARLTYRAAPFAAAPDAAREIIAAEATMQQSRERAKREAIRRGLMKETEDAAFDALFSEKQQQVRELIVIEGGEAAKQTRLLFSNAEARYAGSTALLLMLMILSLSQFLYSKETRQVNSRVRCVRHGASIAFLSDCAALLALSFLLAGASVPFAVGRALPFLGAALAYAFAVAGLGALLASVSSETGGTETLAPFIVLITSLFGGCFFDAAAVSPALAAISLLTPQGLFIAAATGSGAAAAALALIGAAGFLPAYFSAQNGVS